LSSGPRRAIAAGLGTAATGALLLTLPAISFVTMALIWRSHGTRTTALAGTAVAVTGLLGAATLKVRQVQKFFTVTPS